jgi:hypothetical protein
VRINELKYIEILPTYYNHEDNIQSDMFDFKYEYFINDESENAVCRNNCIYNGCFCLKIDDTYIT